jgi:hypothetical protein
MINLYATVYLTIASILQSAVFALLVTYVALNHEQWKTPSPWILSVSTFILIVVLWHDYVIVSLGVVWIISIYDAVIHFVMGAAEMVLVFAISDATYRWFLATAIFAFVSTFALLHTRRQLYSPNYKHYNRIAAHDLGPWPTIQVVLTPVASALMFTLYLLARDNSLPTSFFGLSRSLALSLMGLFQTIIVFLVAWLQWRPLVRRANRELENRGSTDGTRNPPVPSTEPSNKEEQPS